MDLEFGSFLPEHVASVVKLEQECRLEVWRAQDYVEMLHRDPSFYGLIASPPVGSAEGDGRVVGFIAGRILKPEAEIYKLAVGGCCRRQGIGSEMIRLFLRMAAARGVHSCFLEVRRSNTSAISFYEKHGFSYFRTRALYYSEPIEDGLVMIRTGGMPS